jgi:PIN domain nuclease of toxin-antitoxin system
MEDQKIVYLDTHSVIWLIEGDSDWLSKPAQRLLEAAEIRISPIVGLELQLLYELKRLKKPARHILTRVQATIGAVLCEAGFVDVIEQAYVETWTRDPFDRIIVAHAKTSRARLLTADESILRHYNLALC